MLHRRVVIAVAGLLVVFSAGWLWNFTQGGSSGGGLGRGGVLGVSMPASVSLDVPFDVEFKIDTQGQAVNAIGIYASFDPRKLEIINLDTTSSFCQFYPENKYDNTSGKIRIACGVPSPGFTGENVVATATFVPKGVGQVEITLDEESQMLLNDGKGTDILLTEESGYIEVINTI